MNDFFQSKRWAAVLTIVFILFVIFAIFEAGVAVGFHKAGFAGRMSGDYYRVFGQSKEPLGQLDQDSFPASHGVTGTIVSVDPPFAFIKGPDNVERTIRLGSSTTILKYRDQIGPDGLGEGDSIIVIGSPDASSSQIDARFVRVVPPSSDASTSNSQN